MWLAPNLLTLLGWVMMVTNVVLLAFYDYRFDSSAREKEAVWCQMRNYNLSLIEIPQGHPVIPAWVWFWCAFAQFVGHTMDGCDGMQARRTKSSSPLGKISLMTMMMMMMIVTLVLLPGELFDHGFDSWTASLQAVGLISLLGGCY